MTAVAPDRLRMFDRFVAEAVDRFAAYDMVRSRATLVVVRVVLVAVAVGMAVYAEGLRPPYVFAHLVPVAPGLWRWTFRLSVGVTLAWAIDPCSRRMWATSFATVTLGLTSRCVAFALLAEPTPWPAVAATGLLAALWIVVAVLFGILTGVVRPRWER